MKKALSLFMLCILLSISSISAFTEGPTADSVDLSAFTTEELLILKNRIDIEIATRNKETLNNSQQAADSGQYITFSALDWGMDAESALKILKSKKYANSNTKIRNPENLYEYDHNWTYSLTIYEDSGMRISGWCEESIAGYAIVSVNAYFYYDYNEYGVNKSTHNSHLYMVEIILKPIDYDYAESDLKTKLMSLYGNPIEELEQKDDRYVVTYEWYGIENSAVCLHHYKSGTGEDRYDSFELIYWQTGSENDLRIVSKMIVDEKASKERQNSDNYDGLQ